MKRLALALLLAAEPALALRWQVDPAKSSIGFQAMQTGKPVNGRFERWNATIDFDPAAPQGAKIAAVIDLASARTGDRMVDSALPGEDWLGATKTPQARFTAASVAATGPGRYVAKGSLAIRGRAVPVELPFTLAIAGDVATMRGQLDLDRRRWGIGTGIDPKGEWVGFDVPVRVELVARRVTQPN